MSDAELSQAMLVVPKDYWDSIAGPAVNQITLRSAALILIEGKEFIFLTDTNCIK